MSIVLGSPPVRGRVSFSSGMFMVKVPLVRQVDRLRLRVEGRKEWILRPTVQFRRGYGESLNKIRLQMKVVS